MINPQDLQSAIVAQLRAIPELVSFIGDVAEIQDYDDESQISGTTDLAEFSMMVRALLVFWTGSELPRVGETRGWKHNFKIALKAESIMAYNLMTQLIVDGVPDISMGDGFNSFLNCEIHPGCDGIQDATIEPERSADSVGRVVITFSLYER